MKSKLLCFLAGAFILLAVFSCQKNNDTVLSANEDDTSVTVANRCPSYGYDFMNYGHSPWSKKWVVTNKSTSAQKYWLVARSYNGIKEVQMWQRQALFLQSGESENIIAFTPENRYPRVYSMYSEKSLTRADCVIPMIYPHVSNFSYTHKVDYKGDGYWEITGYYENGDSNISHNYSNAQIRIRGGDRCSGGSLLMDTPVRITNSGGPYRTQTRFKVIVEDDIIGDTKETCVWFSYYHDYNFPN